MLCAENATALIMSACVEIRSFRQPERSTRKVVSKHGNATASEMGRAIAVKPPPKREMLALDAMASAMTAVSRFQGSVTPVASATKCAKARFVENTAAKPSAVRKGV